MRQKHTPVRTCIVCRSKDAKRSLIRIVRTEAGVQVDPGGKLNGRGAYLCERTECWERAIKGDVLDRALRMKLSAEDRTQLQNAKPPTPA